MCVYGDIPIVRLNTLYHAPGAPASCGGSASVVPHPLQSDWIWVLGDICYSDHFSPRVHHIYAKASRECGGVECDYDGDFVWSRFYVPSSPVL